MIETLNGTADYTEKGMPPGSLSDCSVAMLASRSNDCYLSDNTSVDNDPNDDIELSAI